MAEGILRKSDAVPIAVGAAVADPRVNWNLKLNDIKFTPFKPVATAAPKFALPKLAPFPKTLPLPSGPMSNFSSGSIPTASGPAGGILSALFPLAILAMLVKAMEKMVGKLIPNKPASQPAH